MKTYNKLVRDKIPEIISKGGNQPVCCQLSDEEYLIELDKKLDEEVKEYLEDKCLEEMADVLEVLYAICEARGYSKGELESKRAEKVSERGGFQDRVFLEKVIEGDKN